jgi:putative membrane protein
MNILVKLLLNAVLVFALAWALPGVSVESFWSALVAAVILGFLNIFIKPILIVITIPVTLLTLGLFLLVINALVILMVDWIVDGFVVANFWWALLFSLILSVLNATFDRSAKEGGNQDPFN